MRRGELLEFAQRLREQQIAENKAGLRELIAKDVEEFLKGCLLYTSKAIILHN